MVRPNNPRYQIDRKEGYVSWNGFTFYFSSNLATGLSLFDIRFNNSRVIYSIDLQEALSHYASSGPMYGSMYWFDALLGMGLFTLPLILGYDCPAYADFLNTAYYTDQEPIVIHNGVCLFEYTADHPISRHTGLFLDHNISQHLPHPLHRRYSGELRLYD
jgi:primary-amine oxidase